MQVSVTNKESSSAQAREEDLAGAYWRLGQAFAAEPNHPDQRNFQAAKVLYTLLYCVAYFGIPACPTQMTLMCPYQCRCVGSTSLELRNFKLAHVCSVGS